jgi:CRISPR/Cas system-associated exonuclease Cas4 (RecB family)
MQKLKAIFKRTRLANKNGVPSVVNIIDAELKKESRKIYTPRVVVHSVRKFLDCLQTGADAETTQGAFDVLVHEFNMPHKRDSENIHPSELLGGCPRAMYYTITNVPRSNERAEIDPQLQRIFDHGTWAHRYLQMLLRKAGILEAAEVGFYNRQLRLIGHTDGVLRFILETERWVDMYLPGLLFTSVPMQNTVRVILEVKTINSFGFSGIMQRGKPIAKHIFQAIIYATELKIDKILFIYYNKDTSALKEYLINVADYKEYQEDAYEKLEMVNDHAKRKDPPKRMCKTPTEEMALGCVYCNHCFGLNDNL